MKKVTFGLIGNPNCGKSTLFNALTGAKQRVGNWPGVTVERKTGSLNYQDWHMNVIDLPGIYSLTVASQETSLDEKIACETIRSGEIDIIINIVDASNLERSLYLTTQLLEMSVPVVIVVNMIDVARKNQLKIDFAALSQQLQCPVVGICANKKKELSELNETLLQVCEQPLPAKSIISYPELLKTTIHHIAKLTSNSDFTAIRLLEGDQHLEQPRTSSLQRELEQSQKELQLHFNEDIDIVMADLRYTRIHQICSQVVEKTHSISKTLTQSIDNLVLNRILGIPIFLGVMYLIFFVSINVGGAFQDLFDIGSQALFVQGFANLLHHFPLPDWVIAIVAVGIGKGINTTITFIPVIGAMFLCLSFLEASGYMARAAFVMDRLMRALGLPGKSFVPMIVGFGCNVPAIMAARTLENRRDRILTIMMSPFMSCGARLAIYAVFTAAFFPNGGGQNVVFILYLTGIVMAVITGLILRKTVVQGEASPLVMELPLYHWPTLNSLLRQTWHRLKRFLFRAGKVIIPVCMIIGFLNAVNLDGSLNIDEASDHSLLSAIGKTITPIFTPMGITQDNWPATVGLMTGVLAKEVVVGTLNTLYTQIGHLQISTASTSVLDSVHQALRSVPENLVALKNGFSNPVLASAPMQSVDQSVLGVMYQHFDGRIGAIAYLLFVLLYFPCISATAAIARELNRGWATFSVSWTCGIAYMVAVIFYQTATVMNHPLSSISWIIGLITLFLLTIMGMRWYAGRDRLELLRG
jgi:ferrous iron transport protein B